MAGDRGEEIGQHTQAGGETSRYAPTRSICDVIHHCALAHIPAPPDLNSLGAEIGFVGLIIRVQIVLCRLGVLGVASSA
jgi:hypothetical protein